MPKPNSVSVIIPVYQPTDLLLLALESVLRQGPKEVIVVDDASTVALPTLPTSDIPVTVLRHETNSGPGAARNTGVRASIGEWVSFLDADDLWEPGRLELQTRLARTTGCDVVLGKIGYIHHDGGPDLGGREPKFLPNMMGMVLRRELFLEILQDESYNWGEDLDFYIQFKERGIALHQHSDVVAWYRQDTKGLTDGRTPEQKKHDLMRVLRRSLKRRRQVSSES